MLDSFFQAASECYTNCGASQGVDVLSPSEIESDFCLIASESDAIDIPIELVISGSTFLFGPTTDGSTKETKTQDSNETKTETESSNGGQETLISDSDDKKSKATTKDESTSLEDTNSGDSSSHEAGASANTFVSALALIAALLI